MIQLLIWSALSLAAIMAANTVYVVLQGWLGLLLGVRVERVAIGYDVCGLSLLRWRGRHWEWVVGIPLPGGYTKFVGAGDEETVQIVAEEVAAVPSAPAPEPPPPDLPPGSYLSASRRAKIAIQLVGPLSQIALGMICLAIPVAMATKQLQLTSPNASTIRPCAVSGLAESIRPSTLKGQLQLSEDIGTNLFQKIILFRSLDGWGGLVGCLLTCGAAAIHSWSLWLSCLGIVALTQGAMNLLPMPPMNGGHVVMIVVESLYGRDMPDGRKTVIALIGLLLVLIWLGRLIFADVLWLSSASWCG